MSPLMFMQYTGPILSCQRGFVTPSPPKLLDQVSAVRRCLHYANSTEKPCVGWIRRFIRFHNKCHPAEMGADEGRTTLRPRSGAPCCGLDSDRCALRAALLLTGTQHLIVSLAVRRGPSPDGARAG